MLDLYKPTKRQLKQLLQNEVIYDLVRNTVVENNSPANNSITNSETKLNPNVKTLFQPAYHGSPHVFVKFSTDFMGKGEGNQAHGWGVYLAGDKNVSEGYRKNLTSLDLKQSQLFYDGEEITSIRKKAIVEHLLDVGKDRIIKDREKAINSGVYNDDEFYLDKFIKETEWIKSLDVNKIVFKRNEGQLYKVDIPEDDVLLVEELPFSEQPKKVQEALKTIADKTEYRFFVEDWINRNLTGKEIYNELAMHMNIDNRMAYYPDERFNPFERTSKLFNEYGIKGIKYNGRQDGECYVIFDDKAVNILKTYYQSKRAIEPLDDINQRTDKSKYLTDNEVIQLKKDRENFETYIKKLLKNELSSKTILQVVQKLPSAYNNIPELRGKKVVVTQSVYKKIIDLPNKFDKNHKVDRKRAIALPTLLSDPLYILQSTSKGHEDRFVVVANSKGILPKEKLSIILQPDSNVAVVSAYDEVINISEEKKNGRVLYDKKQELSKTVATSKATMMNNSSNIINDNSRNFNPNQDEKNLLMTHNTKIDNLDDILANGNLIAPSFAITKKDYEIEALSKFGDVTFIRKPSRINFDSDNVYNRDIYSPRMPRPEYQLTDGTVVDSYEKESRERLEKQRPEHYKERFKIPTSEMFKDAKKVMFLGYTPSGNRKYKPYTAENILAHMKKEGLLSGENFDYGLSSLMARFAEKQKDLKQLKESAKDGLYSSENLNKEYENLQKGYFRLLTESYIFKFMSDYQKYKNSGFRLLTESYIFKF